MEFTAEEKQKVLDVLKDMTTKLKDTTGTMDETGKAIVLPPAPELGTMVMLPPLAAASTMQKAQEEIAAEEAGEEEATEDEKEADGEEEAAESQVPE